MHVNQTDATAKSPIISPFSDAEQQAAAKSRKGGTGWWIFLAISVFSMIGVGGFFLVTYLNDPLRTLEPFPAAKYMENYRSLEGSKFRAELRVENDLGWKEKVGRIMVFTTRDDPRPIVVMIPPNLASTYFVKGQNYAGELEVKEGGLIYANSCRKN